MEKVIYSVTGKPGIEASELSSELREQVAGTLADLGAHAVQVNVVDDAVAEAADLHIGSSQQTADAIVSVWIDSAVDRFRRPYDEAVAAAAAAGAVGAYLVTESVPVPHSRYPAGPGERTHGFAQIAFLRRPSALPEAEWLDIWLNSHTQIAIDTQDTFLYVQNVVTRVLTVGATPWDAIVEECFPPGAMSDPHVFFDAAGDDERLAEHQSAMFDSVQRFIDFDTIEVIPTSRYVMLPMPAGA